MHTKGLTGRGLACALLALAGLALTACGSSSSSSSSGSSSGSGSGSGGKTVALTQSANGKTVALKTGDTLKITLPENPTTPYAWKFSARPSPQVMTLTSSKYFANPVAPNIVGGGGNQVYTFKVQKAGNTSIALALTYVGRTHQVVRRFGITVQPG